MKTPDEILGEATSRRKELEIKDEVLREVLDLLDGIRSRKFKDWDIDSLSRMAGELSIYLVNLGQMVADAMLVSNSAYIYRKWKYVSTYNKLRKEMDKIKDAEMGADIEASEEYESQLLSQHYADSIKTLYENVERIISVIQSRMKHSEGEKMQSNLSVHQDGGEEIS